MVITIDTPEQATALARELQQPGRRRPVVVITIAQGQHDPYVDVESVATDVTGVCDVQVLATGEASWAFSRELPDGRQVYGGASRVYSTSLDWLDDMHASRLFFAYNSVQGKEIGPQLVSEAFAVAFRDGHTRQAGAKPAPLIESTATVRGCAGGLAVADASGSSFPLPATIRPELVAPGVAAERMFTKGQQLAGVLDTATNRFDPLPSRSSPAEAFAVVKDDDILLARVAKVGTHYVTVTLLPEFDLRIPIMEFESDTTSGPLVTVGEVVTVHVESVADGCPSQISLWDADYAEMATPISVFPEGPAWLVPEQLLRPSMPAQSDLPDAEQLEVLTYIDPDDPRAALLSENADLSCRLARGMDRVATLEREVATLRTQARTARHKFRDLEKQTRQRGTDVTPTYFGDPEDQFRWEVSVAWTVRTTPDDKAVHPLEDYTLGKEFLETLDATDGIDRRKVVEVVADLVSGRAEQMPARGCHPLRIGVGANEAQVTRSDGAKCWRISLQHKSHSARRLHYWRKPDGGIELSSVRVHDDVRP